MWFYNSVTAQQLCFLNFAIYYTKLFLIGSRSQISVLGGIAGIYKLSYQVLNTPLVLWGILRTDLRSLSVVFQEGLQRVYPSSARGWPLKSAAAEGWVSRWCSMNPRLCYVMEPGKRGLGGPLYDPKKILFKRVLRIYIYRTMAVYLI